MCQTAVSTRTRGSKHRKVERMCKNLTEVRLRYQVSRASLL